jgi:hypothetical protein
VSGKPGPKSPAHAAKLRAHLVARGFVGARPPHIAATALKPVPAKAMAITNALAGRPAESRTAVRGSSPMQ